MSIKILDPTSHVVGKDIENIGDLIIKKYFNLLLEDLPSSSDFTWVNYQHKFSVNEVVFIGGANVLGETGKSSLSAIWVPNFKSLAFRKTLQVVPIGVGWWSYQPGPSARTSRFYKKFLSSTLPISVRDEYTGLRLREAGFNNVHVTGCPSMYKQKSFSCHIPDVALITFTNYRPNIARDLFLLKTVKDRFKHIYIFPQGATDMEYMESELLPADKGLFKGIEFLDRDLNCLDNFLSSTGAMHIGTRLHMCMHALQNQNPSICIAIDNRAIELKNTFNHLPVLDITRLPHLLSSSLDFSFEQPSDFDSQFLSYLSYLGHSIL